ncbi:hypothetical protein [uncultured Microbacterium sp.]|uniref:hypothetical protein n=1 Tax=uncultured Microbacterium sp. TaxID=191216 RepID=UPI0025D0C921|nr:hypothetical protein [uncultured Microbacterium sp.]
MTARNREDDSPRIHRHPSRLDAAYYREMRASALLQLRAALAGYGLPSAVVDRPYLPMLTDAQVVTLAHVHYRQRSGLQEEIDHVNWEGVAARALFLHELQDGLQRLNTAEENLAA